MGPEIVVTFFWTSCSIAVFCLVMTLTVLACGSLIKKALWRWAKKKIPHLKELVLCVKSNDDVGAMIAMEQLFEIE